MMSDIPEFSRQELAYLHDSEFLLKKRKITKQLELLLKKSQETISEALDQQPLKLPDDCLQKAGKISRGENYKGLPYLILDYPRLLSMKDIFAFRSMCWWGNFFSCTLQLQGKSMEAYRPALLQNLSRLNNKATFSGLYICVNNSPWDYDYGPENYQAIDSLSAETIKKILHQDFCKLSRKTALNNYPQLPSFARACLLEFLDLLTIKG